MLHLRSRMVASVVALVLVGCGGGATEGGVDATVSGRTCTTGMTSTTDTVVSSPALECASRLCLHVRDVQPDACTATCTTARNCVAAPDALPCATDFVCVAPVAFGPFACMKMCVCASSVPPNGFGGSCP
jgi:hypothetical protein